MRHSVVIGLVLAGLCAAACETPPETCGEYPPGGGPAVIRTRDQELCEITRQRVMLHLQRRRDLDVAKAETLFERSASWQYADTVADLLRRIERDAGPEFADAVRRAVEDVKSSTKPWSSDCEKQRERCMARGAARGAYLALTARTDLVRGQQPKTDSTPSGGGRDAIDIEDLAD